MGRPWNQGILGQGLLPVQKSRVLSVQGCLMGQTQAGGGGLPDGFELLTDLGACYPSAAEQGG